MFSQVIRVKGDANGAKVTYALSSPYIGSENDLEGLGASGNNNRLLEEHGVFAWISVKNLVKSVELFWNFQQKLVCCIFKKQILYVIESYQLPSVIVIL